MNITSTPETTTTTIAKFICEVDGVIQRGVMIDPNDREFRCFMIHFALFITRSNFGFVCAAFCILIILISIFGGIKENYRWFILNQALWDLFFSYDFICQDLIKGFIFYKTDFTCIYQDVNIYARYFVVKLVDTSSYSSLLLLSFTRFLCLYFPDFYDKLTKGRRILLLIVIFNFFTIFIHINQYFDYLRDTDYWKTMCYYPKQNIELCAANNKSFKWKFWGTLAIIFNVASNLKPILCLLLSIISAIFITYRIGRQAAYQLRNNRKVFLNSFRIALVIVLQIFMYIIVFMIDFFFNLVDILSIFDISIWRICDDCFNLPAWLNAAYGLDTMTTVYAIRQCRIFLECIIVLSIMTGYREAMVTIFKFCVTSVKNPRKTYNRIISEINRSRVRPM